MLRTLWLVAFLLAPLSAGAATEQQAAEEARSFSASLVAATEAYRNADPLAAAQVGDLFYQFEESDFRDLLAAKDGALYARLEAEWLAVRRLMKSGSKPEEVAAQTDRVTATIEEARILTGAKPSTSAVFWGSFLIILREGFEALLIIGALIAYLRKSGGERRIGDLYAGAFAAVVASAGLWILTKTVVRISGAQAEMIEGVTMLAAAAVLFYVSYWLISKTQHAKWEAFIRKQMDTALGSKGRMALVGVSFLVVFREGFETILFYEALAASAVAPSGTTTILAGFALGVVALAALYAAIRALGMKLSLPVFFAVTSGLLYWMAFKFAGDGMRELQEASLLGETPIAFVPDAPWLQSWFGIYPFGETLVVQAVMLTAVIVGVWLTFGGRGGEAVEREGRGHREARRSVA